MICIRLSDEENRDEALGFLVTRFACRMFANGETIVPEPALESLAKAGYKFTVVAPATYEHFRPGGPAFRGHAARAVSQ